MRRDIRHGDVWGFREAVAVDPFALSGLVLGYSVIPGTATASTVNMGTANRAMFVRALGGGTISKLGLHVGTASGNICVGVYANQGAGKNATPGGRLATSGSVACPSAGYQEVALTASVAVQGGDWLALVADNTTAQFGFAANPGTSNLLAGLIGYQDTAFPLPATAAAAAWGGRCVALVGVA